MVTRWLVYFDLLSRKKRIAVYCGLIAMAIVAMTLCFMGFMLGDSIGPLTAIPINMIAIGINVWAIRRDLKRADLFEHDELTRVMREAKEAGVTVDQFLASCETMKKTGVRVEDIGPKK